MCLYVLPSYVYIPTLALRYLGNMCVHRALWWEGELDRILKKFWACCYRVLEIILNYAIEVFPNFILQNSIFKIT